jgi:HAD superfamily hydrolase (TIGR01509 family)
MPGAEALVRRCLALEIPMALATSSARTAVEVKVAPHPWMTLISERVYGDDPELGDGKPAPDPFLLAARRLGVEPTECWAFEDSGAGVAAALGAGCLVHVLLPPGVGCQAYPAEVVCLNSLEEVTLGQ